MKKLPLPSLVAFAVYACAAHAADNSPRPAPSSLVHVAPYSAATAQSTAGAPAAAPVQGVVVGDATPAQRSWTLVAGHTIGRELERWGKEAGWHVVWHLPRDIVVPADTVIVGDFRTSASQVIETLSANGVLITANFYTGNNTLVVNGPGTVPQ